MAKSPAFQFYPKDFVSDINVITMTLEQRGAYITLLSYCWIEGSLPDDPRVLQALCNHPSNWDEVWFALEPCFTRSEGRLINTRLEAECKKQAEWRKKSAAGGRKSGFSRREKSKEGSLKGGSRVVEGALQNGSTKREPKSNTPSPSSSSSPDTETIGNIKGDVDGGSGGKGADAVETLKERLDEFKKKEAGGEWWEGLTKAYPKIDVTAELEKWDIWCLSNPQKAPRSNLKAGFRNWVSIAEEKRTKHKDKGGTTRRKEVRAGDFPDTAY